MLPITAGMFETDTALQSYAAMAIVIAGDKFVARKEQDAVVDILLACDRKHAWETGKMIENLKVSWGWDAP
jgi:hypothetical protein